MKNAKILLAIVALTTVFTLTACTQTERALSGAGIGAAVGAGVGGATGGDPVTGAVIGGAVGAAAGALTH